MRFGNKKRAWHKFTFKTSFQRAMIYLIDKIALSNRHKIYGQSSDSLLLCRYSLQFSTQNTNKSFLCALPFIKYMLDIAAAAATTTTAIEETARGESKNWTTTITTATMKLAKII